MLKLLDFKFHVLEFLEKQMVKGQVFQSILNVFDQFGKKKLRKFTFSDILVPCLLMILK